MKRGAILLVGATLIATEVGAQPLPGEMGIDFARVRIPGRQEPMPGRFAMAQSLWLDYGRRGVDDLGLYYLNSVAYRVAPSTLAVARVGLRSAYGPAGRAELLGPDLGVRYRPARILLLDIERCGSTPRRYGGIAPPAFYCVQGTLDGPFTRGRCRMSHSAGLILLPGSGKAWRLATRNLFRATSRFTILTEVQAWNGFGGSPDLWKPFPGPEVIVTCGFLYTFDSGIQIGFQMSHVVKRSRRTPISSQGMVHGESLTRAEAAQARGMVKGILAGAERALASARVRSSPSRGTPIGNREIRGMHSRRDGIRETRHRGEPGMDTGERGIRKPRTLLVPRGHAHRGQDPPRHERRGASVRKGVSSPD